MVDLHFIGESSTTSKRPAARPRIAGVAALTMCSWVLPPLPLLQITAARLQNQSMPSLPPRVRLGSNASCAVGSGVVGALAALQISEGTASNAKAREAAFTAVTSHASVTACSMRARKDIAESAAAATVEMVSTEFAMTIIKTIAMPLIMSFLTPFILKLVMSIMPFIHSKMTPKISDGVAKPLVTALQFSIEMNIGIQTSKMLNEDLHAILGMMLGRSLAFHLPRVLGREMPPALAQYVLRYVAPRAAKTMAHKLVHSIVHSLTHSIASELGKVVITGVTKSLGHSLVHYYYCIYCYTRGDYCHFCHSYNQFQRLGRQVGGLGRYAQTESSTV